MPVLERPAACLMPSRNSLTKRVLSTSSSHQNPIPPRPFSSPVLLSTMTAPLPPGTLMRRVRVGNPDVLGTLGFVRYTGKPRLVVIMLLAGDTGVCRSSAILALSSCRLTVTTLAQYRQKGKRFLSVARLILTVCRQNLSFRFEESQTVEGVSLLIYQYPATITRRRSAIPARRRRRRASVPLKIAAGDMPACASP